MLQVIVLKNGIAFIIT